MTAIMTADQVTTMTKTGNNVTATAEDQTEGNCEFSCLWYFNVKPRNPNCYKKRISGHVFYSKSTFNPSPAPTPP